MATKKTAGKTTVKATKKGAVSEAAPAANVDRVLSIKAAGAERQLNARPDGLDFRDRMYVPTLIEVPVRRPLESYLEAGVPILDQGREGACTGFGLATVAHYLFRTRKVVPDPAQVSPLMFYDMARRYDEWAGVDYEGSSCRGAMKGWHKHGVCIEPLWGSTGRKARVLSDAIERDAAARPLGAYFRVNHKDIVAMHAAIAEVGVLYASAGVHAGWQNVKSNGIVQRSDDMLGGHAFAIVAYDSDGFWVQNSWGDDWGRGGFCRVSYEDWLRNGTDTWVARLGAPIALPRQTRQAARSTLSATAANYSLSDIRPHVVNIGNDGVLDPRGEIGTTRETVREIFEQDFPRITKGWKKKRIVLYAHGGLVSQESALQVVDEYLKPMLDAECYPLAFVWKSDFWSTLGNILADAARKRRPEGFLDSAKDFMLDRLDDALEPVARLATGKASWDEMKENALRATSHRDGGARFVAEQLARLVQEQKVELHVVGHSAGSIFHGPLIQYLTSSDLIADGPMARSKGLGVPVASCTLWAPACTIDLFRACYLPAIKSGAVGRFSLFTLTDKAEQDDNCARIYNKSLLYLVSNAFERRPRVPLIRPHGEPILGMARFVERDADVKALFRHASSNWITAPNNAEPGSPSASGARHHGDFDNDAATVQATLARILGKADAAAPIEFTRSATAKQNQRSALSAATGEFRLR